MTMTSMWRRVLVVLSGLILVLGTMGVGPAQAATYAGGLNLPEYCTDHHYDGATPDGRTVYDWRCYNRDGTRYAIDIPDACRSKYGPTAIDRAADFNNKYSWQCYRTSSTLVGGLDLPAYCRSIGYQGATTVGTTAYDWRCVNFGGALGGLNTTRACQWQYNGLAVDRFRDFYDRYSWECRV
jgi:hypothetical protein